MRASAGSWRRWRSKATGSRCARERSHEQLALGASQLELMAGGDPLANISLIDDPANNVLVITKDGKIDTQLQK
jgi:hypothetical protein